jgi:hypothetical protein
VNTKRTAQRYKILARARAGIITNIVRRALDPRLHDNNHAQLEKIDRRVRQLLAVYTEK